MTDRASVNDNESVLLSLIALAAVYSLSISTWRLIELAGLPSDLAIHPDFPSWLLSYLWTSCVWLFLAATVTLAVSILRVTGRIRSSQWFQFPAMGMTAWITVHSLFSLQDKAIGEGGLVWGAIHILTLTRNFTGATELAEQGYRVGQIIGSILWCLFPLLLFAAAISSSTRTTSSTDQAP